MREARRAGMIAASTPATIATTVNATSSVTGSCSATPYFDSAWVIERGEEDPERNAHRRADQRRDDALVADHAPRLAAGHADRAQHPELTRALVDGQHERVDHPEQAHDHARSRAARRASSGSISSPSARLLSNSAWVVTFASGIAGRGLGERRLRAAVDERERVLRARERAVERLLRDRDVAEQRVHLGGSWMPTTRSLSVLPLEDCTVELPTFRSCPRRSSCSRSRCGRPARRASRAAS